MPSLNRVQLIGNLTREPSLKAISNGTQVCEICLAINRRYRSPDGVAHATTTYVEVALFGRIAAASARFLHKGSLAYVEGSLSMDEWTDKTGARRKRLSVRGEQVLFLDPRGNVMNDVSAPVDASGFTLARTPQPQPPMAQYPPPPPPMGC